MVRMDDGTKVYVEYLVDTIGPGTSFKDKLTGVSGIRDSVWFERIGHFGRRTEDANNTTFDINLAAWFKFQGSVLDRERGGLNVSPQLENKRPVNATETSAKGG